MKTTKKQSKQIKIVKPTLNLRPFARAIVIADRNNVRNTRLLAQEILRGDAAIRKTFKSQSDRKVQRRKLTTLVGRLRGGSPSARNNLSSQMSQIFSVADKKESIRTAWLAGRYGSPYTIAVVKTLRKAAAGRSPRKRLNPQQFAYQFVRDRGWNLAKLVKHITELQRLVKRVRGSVSRQQRNRKIRFASTKAGLALA